MKKAYYIVLDDVSSLADKSNEFRNFLTVCRKLGYSLFISYNLPCKIWQMIILQTKIFNVFPGSIQLSNILKIIMNNCHREIITYSIERTYD